MTYENSETIEFPTCLKPVRALKLSVVRERLTATHRFAPNTLESSAKRAVSLSKEMGEWCEAYDAGLVRLLRVCDTDSGFDDLAGDMFSDECAIGYPGGKRAIEKERKEFLHKFENYGAIGLVAQYRPTTESKWRTADSLWSIEGWIEESDLIENFSDVWESALEKLRECKENKCPHCGQYPSA